MAHFVIMGCGRVGVTLAHTLDESGHSVAVIDQDADAFRRASAELGVTGRAVGVVNGHNYSRGDDVSLTVYAPAGTTRR